MLLSSTSAALYVYDHLLDVIGAAFEPGATQSLYDTCATLIEPRATTEVAGYSFLNGASDFYSAIAELQAHVCSRAAAVNTNLSEQ